MCFLERELNMIAEFFSVRQTIVFMQVDQKKISSLFKVISGQIFRKVSEYDESKVIGLGKDLPPT